MKSLFLAVLLMLGSLGRANEVPPVYYKLSDLKAAMLVVAYNRWHRIQPQDPSAAAKHGLGTGYPPNAAFQKSMAPDFALLNDVMEGGYNLRDPNDPRPILSKIMDEYGSTEVQEAGKNAILALDETRKRLDDAENKALEERLERLKEMIRTDTNVADYDEVISNFIRPAVHSEFDIPSPDASRIAVKGEKSGRVTRYWQEYLAYRAAEDWVKAGMALQLYESYGTSENILPPTDLSEPAQEAWKHFPSIQGIASLASQIKDLDGMIPALMKIRALDLDETTPAEQGMVRLLRRYVEIRGCILSGMPQPIYSGFPPLPGDLPSEAIGPKMLRFAVKDYLKSFPGAPMEEDESLSSFVDRVIADAVGRGDGTLLGRAIAVTERIDPTLFADQKKADWFIAGLHQEEASQTSLAILSYQQALKLDSPRLPREAIEARLNRLAGTPP